MADYTTDDPMEEAPIEETQGAEPVQQQLSPADKLAVIMQVPNIAAVLSDSKLGTIAQQVIDEYQIDVASRTEWKERIGDAMSLAMMVAEKKDYPFDGAANIKYPLLTVAALQFNARAYPAIVQADRVARCKTQGRDPEGKKAARGERVSEHLSYQLLSEDPAWEEDTDKLLVILPIVGSAFRKVWFDPSLKRKRSLLVSASDLVVNYFARSMQDVPRITQEMRLYPYEIAERIRGKRFIDFNYSGGASAEPLGDDGDKKKDTPDPQDKDAPHLFLEQHRLLDLDEDGYPEPYVVTVHLGSQKVCRIAANFDETSITIGDDGEVSAIRRIEYFVKYQFLPSPDGGFYGWGFGWLLKDIGESINSTLNMMMDAGHIANIQGGLVSGSLGIKEKSIRLKMGEWKVLQGVPDIAKAIMPITYPGPSDVLFKLLGLLIEAGREVASIKDVLTGDTPATAPVGTTLAIIEQGLQVFTSIYKRIHRAVRAELALHVKLNRQFQDPKRYQDFFDGEQVDPKQDYADDLDVLPVSDPNSVSKMQRLGKAQFIHQIAQENPAVNQFEATRRMLEAAEVEDVETLLIPPSPPDPEQEMLLKIAAMLELKDKDAKIDKTAAETVKTQTAAMKDLSDISSAEKGDFMARAKLVFDALKTELAAEQTAEEAQLEAANGQGRVPAVEGQPANAMGAVPPQGAVGPGGGIPEGAAVPVNGIAGPGMGIPASPGGP